MCKLPLLNTFVCIFVQIERVRFKGSRKRQRQKQIETQTDRQIVRQDQKET